MKTCKRCMHWRDEVECRRYPPVPLAIVESETVGSNGEYREMVTTRTEFVWPQVCPDDVCGEFESRRRKTT